MRESLPRNFDTLVIDNYDSFTYNIVHYLQSLGSDVQVFRNDEISVADIEYMNPKRILISPGPGTPFQSGISIEALKHFAGKKPIFGVCLGLQCMIVAYGGIVTNAGEIRHGKISPIYHDGKGLFEGLNSPINVVRYHSLAGVRSALPDCFEVSAVSLYPASDFEEVGSHSVPGDSILSSEETVIQAVRHKEYAMEGVQYHPESVLTEHGHEQLQNFLRLESGRW